MPCYHAVKRGALACTALVAALLLQAPAATHAQDVGNLEGAQKLLLQVQDGAFEPNWLDAETGSIMLAVTPDGPYIMIIDPLMAPQMLPASATTDVDFEAPDPGEFTLQLIGIDGTRLGTATLNVTEPGF
jgi:hypothetical protein